MSDPSRPTSPRALREVLDELHEALAAASDLDDEGREALAEVARKIHENLEREERPAGEWQSLRQRLMESVERFEESHPRLTEIVGRVAESLSELGI